MIRPLITAALLITPALAQAQPDDKRVSPLAHPLIAVSGGASGFLSPTLRDVVHDGGAWSVRATSGDRRGVRIELAYLGSVQPLDASEGSTLLGSGLHGHLRINVAPWVHSVEPFFFTGVGWTHYRTRDQQMTASLRASDNVVELPFGLGVARAFGDWIVDVRGSVDIASAGDLLPIPKEPDSSRDSEIMHRYVIGASLGFQL